MVGPIVQNIALCLYGNAFLNGETVSDFINNSTAQFCKEIQFGYFYKNKIGKIQEKILYNNPDIFLKEMNSLQTHFNLYYEPVKHDDGLEERMSAGFIGGGGKWLLLSTNKTGTINWSSLWNVIDQNNPDNKIWGVKYIQTGNKFLSNEKDENYLDKFYNALDAIYNFTVSKNDSAFADNFKNAMTTLDSHGEKLFGYHKDLVPDCYKKIEYILDACQSAWVFGGMGTWNDVYFEDDSIFEEYKTVSDNLYSSLIIAVIQSVNSVQK